MTAGPVQIFGENCDEFEGLARGKGYRLEHIFLCEMGTSIGEMAGSSW